MKLLRRVLFIVCVQTVFGVCPDGKYGPQCSLTCGSCKNSTCHEDTGVCQGCSAGYQDLLCVRECIQSYGENCQYPCSGQCINQTCDRFNGNCFCDAKYDSLQNVETDVASSTFWIVAFFISLLINTVLTSTILINRRKSFLKQKSETDKVHFSCRSGSITEQTVTTDDTSHYQDLSVSQNENTYQTLNHQCL